MSCHPDHYFIKSTADPYTYICRECGTEKRVPLSDPSFGFFFDGTWREDEMNDERDSNVVRFMEAHLGQSFYYPGIGSGEGLLHWLGGVFGMGGRDIIEHACSTYEAVALRDGKPCGCPVDIVGFSRGAALGLHFANVLWRKYKQPVRFLGLFDTVGAFGIPVNGFLIPFQQINLGWLLKLPRSVGQCSHALSAHEGRRAFKPTRLTGYGGTQYAKHPRASEVASESFYTERWFAGGHTDIGGPSDWPGRAEVALSWLFEEADRADVPLEISATLQAQGDANELARHINWHGEDVVRRSPDARVYGLPQDLGLGADLA